ncbi:MAG: hypothetical protein ACXVI3_02950 [Halobacteriota archaeon]
MANELEDSDVEELKKLSELQKAILKTLIPEAPYAVHAEVLREAAAPFLTVVGKKEQRRELHEAANILVELGFVKYFCCFIDSYAMNPAYTDVSNQLIDILSKNA